MNWILEPASSLRLAAWLVACFLLAGPGVAQQPTSQVTTGPDTLTDAEKIRLTTLSQLLRDDTLPADKRQQIAVLLFNEGWKSAETVLVETLSNKDSPPGRIAVAEALASSAAATGRLCERFVEPLMAALGEPNEQVSKSAARALALYQDRPEVVAQLRALALDASKPVEPRRAAIVAFSSMRPSAASIEPLIGLLSDKDADLQARAIAGLNRLTAVGLADVAAWQRWWAENRDKSPLVWVNQLNQRLSQENHELALQQEVLERRLGSALESVYQSLPESQQPDWLLKALTDPLPAVRLLGLRLVDRIISEGKVAKLSEPIKKAVGDRLADDAPQVRASAADVIAYLGDADAPADLLSQLAKEKNVAAKSMMIRALARLQSPEAAPELLKLLAESRDRAIASESARALGAIAGKGGKASKDVVESIAAALLDRYGKLDPAEQDVREALVNAMADMGHPRFAAALIAGLTSPSAAVRQGSARGLGNLDVPAGPRNEATDALIGQLSVERDRGVRLELVKALGKFGPGRGPLDAVYVRTNQTNEPDEAVRKQAWETLIKVLKSGDKATQLTWARQFATSADPAAAAPLVDLLLAMEAAAKPEAWPPAEMQALTEQLADALMKVKRPAEAAPRYEQIYRKAADKGERADAAAMKYFQSLLAANQPMQAIDLFKQRQSSSNAADLAAMADALLGRIRTLAESKDASGVAGALGLIAEMRRQLPQASKTAAWAVTFKELATQATKAYAAYVPQQVRQALDQMGGSDATTAAAARKRIEQIGPAAYGVLLDELEAAIAAGEPAKPREQIIVSLLTGPPVEAKDYDPAAPADKKKALLAAYRERLSASLSMPD